MNKQHFDCRGKVVRDFFAVLSFPGLDYESKQTLRRFGHHGSMFLPDVCIRVYKGNREFFTVTTGGLIEQCTKTYEFSDRTVKSLASLIRKGGGRGWAVKDQGKYFEIVRRGRIIKDPIMRWYAERS